MYELPAGLWYSVTWFGDSGILLPAALWIAVWLAYRRETRPVAWLWVLLFGGAAALVALSKIAFMGWGIGNATLNFTGISGHTMLSASIWPVTLWLMASRWEHRLRVAAAVVGWLFAALIGLSRLAIFAHSKSEVAAGLALGCVVSACFLWLQHRRAHPRVNWAWVLMGLVTPMLFTSPGTRAPTHDLLEVLAVRLAGVDRPFTREDLLRGRAAKVSTKDTEGA